MKKLLLVAALSAVAGGFATRAFAEPQPYMRAALGSLETALTQLDKASADKGGHRVKAAELIRAAIVEVKLGIDFDNKH